MTATDPITGAPIDGLSVLASDLFGLLAISASGTTTGEGFNLPGQLVFDVSIDPTKGAKDGDIASLTFTARGWDNGNVVTYHIKA